MTQPDARTAGTTRIISADCHVNEPPHVFDRVPAEYRDRTPRLMRGADGGDGWSFDGTPPKRTYGIEAMAGRTKDEYVMSGLRFEDILPGNYDGAAHIADMDTDGVDVSVVYPGHAIFTYQAADRGLAQACMLAYNDWILDEFQAADPTRVVGLPMLPVDDGMAATTAELERVMAAGAKAAFLPGNPVRPYHDPYYADLWNAAESNGLPLTYHRTFGGKPQESDWDNVANNNFSAAGTVHRFFSSTRQMTYMTLAGVFERHPGLRFVVGEVNFGWLPFWAQTVDEQFEIQAPMGTLQVTAPPSAALGEQLFVTVLDDRVGFDLVRSGAYPYLAKAAMFSTDYPHSVCLWPNTRKTAEELTRGLDARDTEAILSGNAARVYGV
ncbi:amidohydrolase family protein [Yinghuangia soli]|uniref:Amidohydrolase n=1 Tax=Yinghuangia soli TaxID=2908204 RepID=A0AA41Q3X0_9ACTN|nr:amidohydrolase family protein [Yinghuangia soli]MCF2530861.1 amidohydrolase [Yinghuangia soli]